MSLSSLIWGQSQFDEAVDKATSELRLAEEDIALNLEICDQIRSKSVPPKDAARALKRRLNHKNPNVQLLALGLTDVCVKNGGDHFLNEVASKEFMDNLVSILRIPSLNIDVKNKALRLIQNWSVAFEGKYTLGYVGQVYKELVSEGFRFPPKDMAVANSAMVDTSTAPDWIDSDVCLRCRTAFTFTNRKHHCRNCGQVFDQQCSSKSLPLPHFGITQEVRVCDGCFAKLSKGARSKEKSHSADFYSGHHRSSSSHSHKHRSVRDSADADLQRAIQLSLAESSAISSHRASPSIRASYNQWQSSEPPLVDRGTRPNANGYKREEDDDPDLKAAIEASLREASAPKPSAPVVTPYEQPEEYVYETSTYTSGRGREDASLNHPPLPTLPNHDLNPKESDAILTFSQTVQDVHSRGGSDFSRISSVHEMYDRANGLRPKLAISLDDTDRKEQMLSEMHDKLSQAVKLYDELLTKQLSHPTWRTASASQYTNAHGLSQYHTTEHPHRRPEPVEWRREQYVNSPPPAEPNIQATGYSSNATQPTHVQNRPPVRHQASYTSEYNTGSNHVQVQQPTQSSERYQQQSTPTPLGSIHRETYRHPPQLQQSWPGTAFAEPATSQPQPQYQPSTPAEEYRTQIQQYQPQQGASLQGSQPQTQPYQPQPHFQHAPTSPSIGQQQPPATHHPPVQSFIQSPAAVAQHQYAPMVQPVQSPPPQQHYYQSKPASTLSRHNTFSQPSYTSPPAPPSATLGRSNTIGSHLQPQHAYAPGPEASSALPAFPTAPTMNPQAFPMYSPPVSGLEQTEKKEVALIEL